MYPVDVTRQLALRSLSVAELGNRKLPDDLSSSPPTPGALYVFGKQQRVRRGRTSGGDSLPSIMWTSDQEEAGREVRVVKGAV